MFSLSCCLVVAVGLLHHARSQQHAPCFSQPDGSYANYTTRCRSYYRCVNYAIVDGTSCPTGSIFDVKTGFCESAASSCVPPNCAIGDHGSYALPQSHCSRYYKCHGDGQYTEKLCPQGTAYSTRFEQCMRNADVCYEPDCTGRSDGAYRDTTSNCRRGYRCQTGILKELKGCPRGEVFDGKQCLPEEAVGCESQETTAFAVPVTSSEFCHARPDGWRMLEKTQCRSYIVCKNGALVRTATCGAGQQYDGTRCSPVPQCDDACADRSDGFYMVDGTYCKKYFYCSRGRVTTRGTCPEDTVFNGHVCVPSPLHSCAEYHQDECRGKQDGSYRNYSDCQSYYTCRNGELLRSDRCGYGMMWSDEGRCVQWSEELCLNREVWTPCASMAEGLYQNRSAASGCRSYYFCFKNGLRTRFTCPVDRVFDGASCVSSHAHKCRTESSNACTSRQDGYYQDRESGCRSYFYCSGGNKITYVCPDGYIFNGAECVSELLYDCPNESNDCQNSNDGYYADTRTKCRDYFYCLRNKRVTTLTCSDNRIFNGERCVQPLEYECPGPTLPYAELCSNKEDGYYADMSSGCTKYFRCLRGKLKSQYTCLAGYVYDGQSSCVPKKCSHSNRCERDGFFPDYDAQCRDYYYCIEGKKTVLSCPGDQVFNGQLCVPKHVFSCQSDCDRRIIQNRCDNNI